MRSAAMLAQRLQQPGQAACRLPEGRRYQRPQNISEANPAPCRQEDALLGLTNENRISEGLVAMDAAENQQCMTCGITRRKVFSESIVCGYELRSFFLPELLDHRPHGVRAALKEKGRTAFGYSTLNPPGVLSRAESLRAVGAVKAVAVLLKFR